MLQNEILLLYPWINSALFVRILTKDHPNAGVNIKDFYVKSALPPGENYGSIMIRANVFYEINGNHFGKRFIIKAGHINAEIKEAVSDNISFKKEIIIFRDILPKIEELLRTIGDHTKFSAVYYESSIDKQYLILEDLTMKDYKNVDRRIGLNVEELKNALTKIAKFHACTAILNLQNYFADSIWQETFLNTEIAKKMTVNVYLTASDMVKKMPEFAHLSEKLLKFIDKVFDKIDKALKSDETDIVCLLHGDLWLNNIMFKFDQLGSPIDALLIDFQGSYIGPSILDVVMCLFYSTSNYELCDRHWDILVQYYHNVLSDTLEKLNYTKSIPTLTDTQCKFIEKGVCYAGLGLGIPGLCHLENDGEDVMDFVGENGVGLRTMNKSMGNPKAEKEFKCLLDYFDRKGYLD